MLVRCLYPWPRSLILILNPDPDYKAREGSRRVSEAGPVSCRTRFARRGGSWFEPGLGASRWSKVLGLPKMDLRI